MVKPRSRQHSLCYTAVHTEGAPVRLRQITAGRDSAGTTPRPCLSTPSIAPVSADNRSGGRRRADRIGFELVVADQGFEGRPGLDLWRFPRKDSCTRRAVVTT
jgi:hypothetical protein